MVEEWSDGGAEEEEERSGGVRASCGRVGKGVKESWQYEHFGALIASEASPQTVKLSGLRRARSLDSSVTVLAFLDDRQFR